MDNSPGNLLGLLQNGMAGISSPDIPEQPMATAGKSDLFRCPGFCDLLWLLGLWVDCPFISWHCKNSIVDTMKGRINIYTCAHGHQTVTVNTHDSAAPITISCRQSERGRPCTEMATTAGYRSDQKAQPQYEWYKPGIYEHLTMTDRVHVKNGGLLLREIGNKLDDPNKSNISFAARQIKVVQKPAGPESKSNGQVLNTLIQKHLRWHPKDLKMLAGKNFVETGVVGGALYDAIRRIAHDYSTSINTDKHDVNG